MIRLDLKFLRVPLVFYILMLIVFAAALSHPQPLSPIEQFEGTYKSDIFYFLDFLLPFFSSLCVIIQLGATFEKNTFNFVCSLPVKSTPLIRWTRSAIFFILVNFVCIVLAYNVLGFPVSFGRMCYLCLANTALFLSLALLLTLLIRQIFYVFCILYGYLLVDLTIGDTLQKKYSVFVNIFAQFPADIIDKNRAVVYIISAACIVFAIIIQKTDIMRKMNTII